MEDWLALGIVGRDDLSLLAVMEEPMTDLLFFGCLGMAIIILALKA